MDKTITIKNLISQGETEAALQSLQDLVEHSSIENEAALLSARFQKIQKETLLGTADETTQRREINQINFAVLTLIDSLQVHDGKTRLPEPRTENLRQKPYIRWVLWAILATLLVSAVLYFSKKHQADDTQTFEFQYVQNGIPLPILSKIDSLQKVGQTISYLAFLPENKGWMIFYGRNKYLHNGNFSEGLIKKLNALSLVDDAELKGLYLGKNSSFIAWFDANDFWYYLHSHNQVDSLIETLYRFNQENREISDIAISPDPDRSWVVLTGNLTYTFRALDKAEYRQVLHEVVYAKNGRLKQFAFTKESGDEWLLLYDFNSFEAGNIDPNLRNKLSELQRDKREILKVFMRGFKEWIVFYK